MQNYDLQPCNFSKWAIFESWPIEQAAIILLGYEPPPIHYIKNWLSNSLRIDSSDWDMPDGWRDISKALSLSIAHKKIPSKHIIEHPFSTYQVTPSDLVIWAKSKGLNVPLELAVFELEPMQSEQRKPTDKDNDSGEKEISGKSETSYLNIVGALCDLYWREKYPDSKKINQAELIGALQCYEGFSGMSERNLKDKLSKAIKAIERF